MLQQKKLHANLPKYHLDIKDNKAVGKKINKNKQIKSKIFKNLSQFPIQLTYDAKENASIGHANRPHSSLVNYEPNHPRAVRVESAMSHYNDANKKRLSLDSTGKKYERDSLVSRGSLSKKMSKNNKSIDEGIKTKLADERRKYNISCNSAIDQSIKCQLKTKKNSIKAKRYSINNLQMVNKHIRGKQEKQNIRDFKDIKCIVVNVKDNRMDKSKSKSKNKRKKSTVQLDKSKASTAIIGGYIHNQKSLFKKKQSTSTVQINAPAKKQKQCKKKIIKKKSDKIQAGNAPIEQFSLQQYPINKYDIDITTKKSSHAVNHLSLKRNSKSKSRKGSTSKQNPHRKTHSMLEIDYSSCINIPSNSSGLINTEQSYNSPQNTQNIKIMQNWQFKYMGEEVNHNSVNLDEIRYYQSFNYSKKKQERQFINQKFKDKKYYKKRQQIQNQICQDYPHFGELQLKFLSSVVFIQRKWRQFKLYKDIFTNLNLSPDKAKDSLLFIQKSNSKQLNISQPKSPEKSKNKQENVPKSPIKQINILPFVSQAESTSFETVNNKQKLTPSKSSQKKVRQPKIINREDEENWKQLNSQICVQPQSQLQEGKRMSEFQCNFDGDRQLQDSQGSQRSLKSHGYEFLSSQIFPSMTYLLIKKQQLKLQLFKRISELNQMHKNNSILYTQYLKLRQKYQRQYELQLKQLHKSKRDIKKGYLKFIDTYKFIKHEALRKVSSESGFMTVMYHKVFQFDQESSQPSNSTESMKQLKKKILIRKQFFHNQIEAYHLDNSPFIESTMSERNGIHSSRQSKQLSARCFRSKKDRFDAKMQNQFKKKQIFLDIDCIGDNRLEMNRIREGFAFSPNIQKIQLCEEYGEDDQLLPISIQEENSDKPQKQASDKSHLEKQQKLILQEVIAILTHELLVELIKIDEKRDKMQDIINDQLQRKKIYDVKEYQIMEESDSVDYKDQKYGKEEDFEIVEQEKIRQIYKIQGLQEKSNQIEYNRKHRNSNTFNISPASSQKIAFDLQDILSYAKELFHYISDISLTNEIVQKLNKNQGFTPLEYLKFLRSFQIPDEQYQPLISNQIFIEWQDQFFGKHYPDLGEDQHSFFRRQTITIFHRCIFESIISFMQQYRPCGEKGIPFPWQNVIYFPRIVLSQDMQLIYQKCCCKIDQTLKLNCGIIDQKLLIYSEQDLQRMHEQNQDKIINMLEKQLQKSDNNWYEVEQHCLQIKLQVENQIFQYLMLQALDELLQNS